MAATRDHGPAALRGACCVLALAVLWACSSGGGPAGGGDGGGGGGGGGRGGGGGNKMNVTPVFQVRNHHAKPRVETIRASVPFPEGARRDLEDVGVSGIRGAWLPLQRWPDGTVKIAQIQFTDRLEGGATREYSVVKDVKPLTGPFQRNGWVESFGADMRFGARLRDRFDAPYEAFASGAGETLQETYLVRVSRHRVYHIPVDQRGIDRDFLTSTFYVTEFRDMPFVVVDWVLGNDYLGADDTTGKTDPNYFPLGAIDVNEARFLVRGVTEARGYLPELHAIGDPVAEPSGWTGFPVMADTYVDDAQTRRYRFLLRFEDPGATDEVKKRWRDTFEAMREEPLFPLPTLKTWHETGAFGLHGGPIAGPPWAARRAESDYRAWRDRDHFGTWGSFGDTKFSNTTGTPRNAPVSPELMRAAQSMNSHLLLCLEQKAWAQAMRAYHLYGLRVGAEQDIYLWDSPPFFPGARDLSRESLGRRALWKNDPFPHYRKRVIWRGSRRSHGWNWYDHEHWSTDFLFDYWTMTGDEWAKEELRQLGESLKGLMRLKRYATKYIQSARAEGWCMVGFVHVYLATGDRSIKEYALRRVHEIVEQQREKDHPSRTLWIQGTYPGTGFPTPHRFFYPWQHGAVLYGYLAAHKYFEDPLSLRIAEDVVPMLDYSWVRNFRDPKYGLVENGLRYAVATHFKGKAVPVDFFDKWPGVGVRWGDSPLGGAHGFLTSGLFLLAKRTENASVRARALSYGRILFGDLEDWKRWYKWNTLVDEDELGG